MKPICLNVLVLNDCGAYVAQCLEHDIAARGQSVQDTVDEFVRVLHAEIAYAEKRGIVPLSNIPKAPEYYWNRFVSNGVTVSESAWPKRSVPPAFMLPSFKELRIA